MADLFASFEVLCNFNSLSSSPALVISRSRRTNLKSSNCTLILLLSSNSSYRELVSASASSFWQRGTHERSSSTLAISNWQASSIATIESGNLLDPNFFRTCMFERLSVKAGNTTFLRPSFHGASLENNIIAMSTANNSKLAIALKGSPRRYAQGTVLLDKAIENQRACLVCTFP